MRVKLRTILLAVISIAVGLMLGAHCVADQEPKPEVAKPTTIIIPFVGAHDATDTNYFYAALLDLALSKTVATDGPYEIVHMPNYLGTERMRLLLEQGLGVDLLWSTSNIQREARFIAVPVNLLGGLNEYRALLIEEKRIDEFKNIQGLDDLKRFRVGSGDHWQDTQVLKHNGLPLVGFLDYETMMPMLKFQRFDYVSRGMHEVWKELEYSEGLTIAPNVLLYYRLPVHYFVRKNNQALADRIYRGLKIIIEDGSYYDLFFRVPSHKFGYEKLQQMKSVVVELENPNSSNKPDMITP